MEKIIKKIKINKDNKFIYFNIFLNQKIDNMGSFSNLPFLSNPVDRNLTLENKFIRIDNTTLSSWYEPNHNQLSGQTTTRLDELKSYDNNLPYIVDFDIETVNYINYNFSPITGVSRITKLTNEEIIYVFDANNDMNIGTINQNSGIKYIDKNFKTYFYFINEGLNASNSILEANYKEEYLNGIIDTLETESDIFIDRGSISVNEMLLKMSEINNLNQLENYGNGFFNLVK